MRIHRVTITGFGPYRGRQSVDFDAYADDGIYLITGRTGAGKSTVLDAICFALYGSVPRYDGTNASTTALRSDYAELGEESLVELEFSAGGIRYRVQRSPEYERPKARGTGTTTQKAEVRLARLADGEWQGLADRAVDADPLVLRIVQLSKEQFLQVVLLAQNRFQEFLRAKSDERQSLLRTLFGSARFERYDALLQERRKALDEQLSGSRDEVARLAVQLAELVASSSPSTATSSTEVDGSATPLPAGRVAPQARLETPLTPVEQMLELVTGLELAQRSLAEASAKATDTWSAARDAHDAATSLHDRQQRRERAATRLAQLEAEAGPIAAAQTELDIARRASAVLPAVTSRDAAARAAQTAAESVALARAAAAAVVALPAQASPAELAAEVTRLTELVGSLQPALQSEGEAAELRTALDTAEAAHAAAVAELADVEAQAAELHAQGTALHARSEGLRDAASRLAAATQKQELLAAASRAAQAADAATTLLETARSHELALGRARTEASAALDTLRERRLRGHAAELARALVTGHACPVCGALEHPAPATASEEPVTEELLAGAEAALEGASAAAEAQTTQVRELEAEVARHRGEAGGRSAAEAQLELVEAESARAEARRAADALVDTQTSLARLEAKVREHGDSIERVRGLRDDRAQELAVLRGRLAEASRNLEEQRAGFPSIADRAAAIDAQRQAAHELLTTLEAQHAAEERANEATAALTALLAEHDFADATAVTAAARDAAATAALETRIRQHREAAAAARATLVEPELHGLPEALVELELTASALAAASAARDAALAAAAGHETRLGTARGYLAAAQAASTASAELDAAYATVQRLAATVHGDDPNTLRMKLESYVLAAELEAIVSAANAHLRVMTGGRYQLEHSDGLAARGAKSGLGLAILDAHTGDSRSTPSLSGGETFLASLALALGLAEVVTARAGGITLDTLFIDEGFGSLDSETLEVAMGTLDALRTGGRTIGLISHVEAMKEQIPAKLYVDVADGGWSIIRQ